MRLLGVEPLCVVCTLLPPSHPPSFHLTIGVAIRFLGCWVSSTPETRGRCRDSRPPWYGTGLKNRNGYSRYAHGLTHIQGGSHFSCASLQYECVLWSLALKSGFFLPRHTTVNTQTTTGMCAFRFPSLSRAGVASTYQHAQTTIKMLERTQSPSELLCVGGCWRMG